MFEGNTIFAIIEEPNGDRVVNKLILDRKAQESICNIFSMGTNTMLDADLEEVEFCVGYTPDKEQIMSIDAISTDEMVIEAVDNPDGVEIFIPNAREYPNIKALFTGCNEPKQVIAFQRFNKSQYLTNNRIGIIHLGNTLKEIDGFGMIIGTGIDCVIHCGKLLFRSYSNARQIFDLAQYYRSASEGEVTAFVENEKMFVEDKEGFKAVADEWTRKKIALIQDSRVLEDNSAEEIAVSAEELGVAIQVIAGKIILPSDKKAMKDVLRVLDEDRYKGVFTNNTYETNSKRRKNK